MTTALTVWCLVILAVLTAASPSTIDDNRIPQPPLSSRLSTNPPSITNDAIIVDAVMTTAATVATGAASAVDAEHRGVQAQATWDASRIGANLFYDGPEPPNFTARTRQCHERWFCIVTVLFGVSLFLVYIAAILIAFTGGGAAGVNSIQPPENANGIVEKQNADGNANPISPGNGGGNYFGGGNGGGSTRTTPRDATKPSGRPSAHKNTHHHKSPNPAARSPSVDQRLRYDDSFQNPNDAGSHDARDRSPQRSQGESAYLTGLQPKAAPFSAGPSFSAGVDNGTANGNGNGAFNRHHHNNSGAPPPYIHSHSHFNPTVDGNANGTGGGGGHAPAGHHSAGRSWPRSRGGSNTGSPTQAQHPGSGGSLHNSRFGPDRAAAPAYLDESSVPNEPADASGIYDSHNYTRGGGSVSGGTSAPPPFVPKLALAAAAAASRARTGRTIPPTLSARSNDVEDDPTPTLGPARSFMAGVEEERRDQSRTVSPMIPADFKKEMVDLEVAVERVHAVPPPPPPPGF